MARSPMAAPRIICEINAGRFFKFVDRNTGGAFKARLQISSRRDLLAISYPASVKIALKRRRNGL